MNKKEYYNIVCGGLHNIHQEGTFNELYKAWRKAFCYVLKRQSGMSKKSAKHLFKYFEMQNSKMFWKDNNPEYSNHTQEELEQSFLSDVSYCSDRMSYDRLFRCHWLFLRAFPKLTSIKHHPNIYEDKQHLLNEKLNQ